EAPALFDNSNPHLERRELKSAACTARRACAHRHAGLAEPRRPRSSFASAGVGEARGSGRTYEAPRTDQARPPQPARASSMAGDQARYALVSKRPSEDLAGTSPSSTKDR